MTHKAILIDPVARTVTEVEQEPGLQQLYDRLSMEGFRKCSDINAVNVGGRNYMYVDGEGMLIPNVPTFGFVNSTATFAGRGLIVSTDDEGDDVAHTLPFEQVAASVVWLETVTTGEIGMGGFRAPDDFAKAMGASFVYHTGDPVLKDRDEI